MITAAFIIQLALSIIVPGVLRTIEHSDGWICAVCFMFLTSAILMIRGIMNVAEGATELEDEVKPAKFFCLLTVVANIVQMCIVIL